MEVREGAIGPDEDTPPEQGMDVPDPGVDQVGVGRGGRIHGVAMLPDQSPDVAFALSLKCSRGHGRRQWTLRVQRRIAPRAGDWLGCIGRFRGSGSRHD